jgi:hypothetical protein
MLVREIIVLFVKVVRIHKYIVCVKCRVAEFKSRQYTTFNGFDDDDTSNNNNVPVKMHYFLYARTNELIGGTVLMAMSNNFYL